MATEALALGAAPDQLERLLLKLRARDIISLEEEQALRRAVSGFRAYAPGQMIVPAGVAISESLLQVAGFSCRYKYLADGQRQMMEIHVPGDFVDLHSFLLKRLEHNVGALTAVEIAVVPHEALKKITRDYPHLTRMLWFSTLLDAAIHRETILSVGRRSAIARIAHLFCELFVRLEIADLADEDSYALPLTQADLADATGLTSVHVNRMLKRLRDEKLLTFRNGIVAIHDWDGLQRVAEFNPSYLFLERRPR